MRSAPQRIRLLLAPSLAAAIAVSACGSSDSTATQSAESTAAAETTDAAMASDTTEAAAAATTEATASTDAAITTDASVDETPDYLSSYSLMDEEFGTMTTVTVDGATRTIETNALPDHETGEFPNPGNPNTISAQDVTYEYPTEPTFVGSATFAMTPGVGLNGVKFEPATAETVTCGSGESYRVEALQDVYDLGLDFNNAHVQPTGAYHYHGISQLMVDVFDDDADLALIGFAADGYLMYYSKSGAYSPSYSLGTDPRTGTECVGSSALRGVDVDVEGTTPDGTYTSDWVFDAATGDLDECNGTEINGEYAYVVTDEYPFVGRCLNGEFTQTGPGAGGPPAGGAPAGGPPAGSAPAEG